MAGVLLAADWHVRVKSYKGFAVPDTTVHIIGIKAWNEGRTSVDVTGWGFHLPEKRGHVSGHMFALPWSGPEVPHTLAPGQSGSWQLPLELFQAVLKEQGLEKAPVRPFVQLGTGKEAVAESIEVTS